MRTPLPKLVGVSIVSGGVPILRTSRTYFELEVRMAAPVRSYCFTVETDLIGPSVLNGAPLKPDANAGT
jgi:hypothetical protein